MKSSSQRFQQLYNIVFFWGLSNFIFSQFQVSPMLIENYLNNDESNVTTIEIKNNGNSPLELSIYLKDKAFIDGKEAEALPGTFERSASQWIYFTPSMLNLEPDETSSIRINMNVPDSAKGTYWANLFIEESSPPRKKVHEVKGVTFNLNINMRLGVLIIETVPGTSLKSGLIESINFHYTDKKDSGFIDFAFYNDGNTISKCTGWLEYRDIDGLPVKKIDLGEIPNIYPRERRSFSVQVPNNLIPGEYSVLAVIDYGGSQLVAGEIIFEYANTNKDE